jgi:hypothetical protein
VGSAGEVIDNIYKLVLRVFSGRALGGVVLGGLLFLSGIAALKGIVDLVTEQDAHPNPLVWVVAALGVTLITLAMSISLERARLPGPAAARVAGLLFYLFCALWSIGFGYGFWWSLLAAKAETTESLDNSVDQFLGTLAAAQARTNVLQQTFATAEHTAQLRQGTEDAAGFSCGNNTGSGRGPFWRRRTDITNRVAGLVATVRTGWLAPMEAEIRDVQRSLIETRRLASQKIELDQNHDYENFFRGVARDATTLNETSRRQSDTIARSLEVLARELSIAPGAAGYNCYDPGLASDLLSAARETRDYVKLQVPAFSSALGARATQQAFSRLYGSLILPLFDLFRTDGAKRPAAASSAGASLDPEEDVIVTAPPHMNGRDWIALLATIIVDIGIVFFAFIRPRLPLQGFMIEREYRRKLSRAIARAPDAARDVLCDLAFQYKAPFRGTRDFIVVPPAGWTRRDDNTPSFQAGAAPLARGPATPAARAMSARVHITSLQTLAGLFEQGGFAIPIARPSRRLLQRAEEALHNGYWVCELADVRNTPQPRVCLVQFRDLTEFRFLLLDPVDLPQASLNDEDTQPFAARRPAPAREVEEDDEPLAPVPRKPRPRPRRMPVEPAAPLERAAEVPDAAADDGNAGAKRSYQPAARNPLFDEPPPRPVNGSADKAEAIREAESDDALPRATPRSRSSRLNPRRNRLIADGEIVDDEGH